MSAVARSVGEWFAVLTDRQWELLELPEVFGPRQTAWKRRR